MNLPDVLYRTNYYVRLQQTHDNSFVAQFPGNILVRPYIETEILVYTVEKEYILKIYRHDDLQTPFYKMSLPEYAIRLFTLKHVLNKCDEHNINIELMSFFSKDGSELEEMSFFKLLKAPRGSFLALEQQLANVLEQDLLDQPVPKEEIRKMGILEGFEIIGTLI